MSSLCSPAEGGSDDCCALFLKNGMTVVVERSHVDLHEKQTVRWVEST